ncbi:hypothetical protein SELMODRAFT_438774 [Selaginella moellendorffii]|uniref:OCRE domain-containing protein n=1 Tax=Selaginella moellendorffii TaxID=88036 RepID=D8QZA9_SELML|nr:CD2 antigen cytoplasmic tail-binding protein 2 homolog [Selaginella moellendorffii]EFJ34764.1 hypothetical protein SELMODRAFT_438774 [Selaginella moellendorffii]|eukprot:XP_002964431.1 CD2 antigen cytoplasmic tail-binding protein 2 homolog [Selaginella moellendorffii]
MEGAAKASRAGSKRARFTYEEPDPDDDDEDDQPRKLKFPKGKKSDVFERGGVDEEEDDGDPRSRSARIAATERAMRRSVMAEQLRTAEDTSNLHDFSQAEESFENDDDAVKLEPFNLNAERRDGFFDDDGHYVEYATKFEARDAWLDSAEVDTRFAAKHLARKDKEAAEHDISPRDIGLMKKRIADALEPGETVLEALRRLRGSTKEGNRRGKLTGPAKIAFDQLTEDAMKLMDIGESDVYDKVQEKFRREADAVLQEEVDIFSDEPQASEPGEADANGYVYDGSSGYYYNAETGYYYDPSSGLFCSAASGQWFKFDEATNAYVEAV